jgi:hypothetical protein
VTLNDAVPFEIIEPVRCQQETSGSRFPVPPAHSRFGTAVKWN